MRKLQLLRTVFLTRADAAPIVKHTMLRYVIPVKWNIRPWRDRNPEFKGYSAAYSAE
ncbi:MAG TPA: hypothetical protein VJJ98_15200 [Sedimentisphaerales bacterium]|nr:hypothetical protein [Sedimentisphaerales bacterium]